ncbi:MAG: sugar phosphate isomerase/epimerase [Desulfobacterales bacterium]|nr:MAG: sugar phosphate isomerase/epimerase [Desulfobacterales bacterium]
MLAISTSWKSKEVTNGDTFIELLECFDITAIELDYRINEALFRQMQEALKRSDLDVVSIHNYFPIPANLPHSKGGGDLFLLSHPEKDERQKAIQMTIRSMEYASDLGAKVVILHCGYVDMDTELSLLYRYWDTNQIYSKEGQGFVARKLKERDYLKPRHLDSLLFSLDKLIHIAEKQNLILGIENRYHYHELPGFNDLKVLFNKFKGGPLGYWHDTGHAHANEILTIIPSEALLKTYSEHLIGVHFHDAIGLDDHLVPGTGIVDFKSMKSYFKKNTLMVIELKPGTPDLKVSQGIRYIRENVMC